MQSCHDHSQMINGIALPPGLLNFVAEASLPDGTYATSIQSGQVALLYFAITSLHSPDISTHSGVLDTEFDIELEDHPMGCTDTE